MSLSVRTPHHLHICRNKMSPNIVKCPQARCNAVPIENHCSWLFIWISPRCLLPLLSSPSLHQSRAAATPHTIISVLFWTFFSFSPGTWEILFESGNLCYTFKSCISMYFCMFPVKGFFCCCLVGWLVILVWVLLQRLEEILWFFMWGKLMLKSAVQTPGKLM